MKKNGLSGLIFGDNTKGIVFFTILITVHLLSNQVKAQTCDELIDFVESKSVGSIYSSPLSSAISYVSFHTVYIEYKPYYFAIVCFNREYIYGCSKYIYAVSSGTEMDYLLSYSSSAGEAFWKYIEPYSDVLGCSPSFN